MVGKKTIFKKDEKNWVSRFIMDEVVIMPLARTKEDVNYIYSISNETGSRIWQLIDGENTVEEVQKIMKEEFNGPAESVEGDVMEFIADASEEGLIKETKEEKRQKGEAIRTKGAKKGYNKPDIARVKMQPEQAVLYACVHEVDGKNGETFGECCGVGCSPFGYECDQLYCSGSSGGSADPGS